MEPTVHAQLGSAFEAVLHRLRAHAGREGHFCALGFEPGVLWQTQFLFQFSGIHTQKAQTLDLISLVSFLLLFISSSRQQQLLCDFPGPGRHSFSGSFKVLMARWKGLDGVEV